MATTKEQLVIRAERMWPIGWKSGWASGIATATVCGLSVEIGVADNGNYRGHVFDHPDIEDGSLWRMLCELRSYVIGWRSVTVDTPPPEMTEPSFTEKRVTAWDLVVQCLPRAYWKHGVADTDSFVAVCRPVRSLDLLYSLELALAGGQLRLHLHIQTGAKKRLCWSIPITHETTLTQVSEGISTMFLSMAGLYTQTAVPTPTEPAQAESEEVTGRAVEE